MLVAVAVYAAVSVSVVLAFDVSSFHRPALAIVRGAVQLAILAVMLAAAVLAASGRLGRTRRTVAAVAAAMASGVVLNSTVVFGLGAVPFTGRYLLALGGILSGGR